MTHCATDVGINTMLQKDRKFKLSLKMMKATINTFPHQNVQNPALYQVHPLSLCRSPLPLKVMHSAFCVSVRDQSWWWYHQTRDLMCS